MDDKELKRSLDDILTDIPEGISEAEPLPQESMQQSETQPDTKSAEISAADDEPAASEEIVVFSAEDELDADEDNGEYDEDDSEDDEEELEERRLELKEKRRKKHRKRRTHGRIIFAIFMVTLVISIALFGAAAVINVAKEILALNRSDTEYSIEIPANSGTESIAQILESEGIINEPVLFRIMSKLKGADGTYVAGIHKLRPNMTYSDVIEELQQAALNPREFVNITFPEGIRLNEAAELLEENGVCSAQEFIRAFNSGSFGFDFEKEVKTSTKKFYKMEGYFFPDTYQFYLDEDPRNVAKKVYKNFANKVTPNHMGRMKDMDMTLEEVMTLASIVQAEAARTSDMKMVASVFLNRLEVPDEFPLLQSDPTSNYVEEVIEPNLEVYSQDICDAYDTYKGGGLPPGPICNPGIEAIEAVLYPRDTSYYYFCSDLSTGEFFFAEKLEQHEENLVKANLT